MDIERTRRLLANSASTRHELEQLFRDALAADERELAADIKDVLEERFPIPSAAGRGAAETIAVFRSVNKHFDTAKEAYIWLVERFIGAKPEVFTDIRWETTGFVAVGLRRTEEGQAIRNYFARSPKKLFRNSPWLAEDKSKYVKLQSGWYANTNLNNGEKFDILVRFGWVVGLKCGPDWDWEVLDPSEGLRNRQERHALAAQLFTELDSLPPAPQT